MRLQGADVVVTDPEAIENAQRAYPDLRYVSDVYEAARGADIVLLLTEWPEFVRLDPKELGNVVAGKRMLDGRNVLDPAAWRVADWTYRALGRP